VGDEHAELFERWRRGGDPQALGEIFDRTAPRLLALAIHLCGDASEAEDLLQETFLVAIQRSAEYDASRPLLPWLSGILVNKARRSRQRAAREIDPERLVAQAEATPLDEATQRELSGALAEALDRIDEPYRGVLVLRLRHGLAVGDIAHALGRSPGTVRVQLHRGLKQLRGMLPAGLIASVLLALSPSRGLAAVRAAVLRRAAAPPVAGSAVAIGGWIMAKKLGLVAAAIAIVAFGVFFTSLTDGETRPLAAPAPQAPGAVASSPDQTLRPMDAPEGHPAEDSRIAAPSPGAAAEAQIAGRVEDGRTNEPIAGARVAYFPPLLLRLGELGPDRWKRLSRQKFGGVFPLDLPWAWAETTGQRFGWEPMRVYDRPPAGETPLFETRTDERGEFTLPSGADGGVLVCEREGYGTRNVAITKTDPRWLIEMWPSGELSGYLLDEQGERLAGSFTLLFWAGQSPRKLITDLTRPRSSGSWIVKTAEDGSFRASFSADFVMAEMRTPGWILTQQGRNPANGSQQWLFPSSFRPGQELEPIVLVARRVPMLQVRDRESGEPVEEFQLLGRDGEAIAWSGRFFAPQGLLPLLDKSSFQSSFNLERRHATISFDVWSERHAVSHVKVPDLYEAGTIPVDLERGRPPVLEGVVLARGEPVVDASLELVACNANWWRDDLDYDVALARSGADGSFHLEAPASTYFLRVVSGERTRSMRADLPRATPLLVEIELGASIEVEVRDSAGALQVGHVVGLHGEDGRQDREETGESGRARFECLQAGVHRVHVPQVNTKGSFVNGILEQVDLGELEQRLVRIEIPVPSEQRFGRVVADGVADYSEWKARLVWKPWTAIEADGTVPLDLAEAGPGLEIETPSGRRWHANIPRDAPDGYVVRVEAGGAGYRGILLDAASGRALGGVRVTATRSSGTGHWPSCRTDAAGRFELFGLEEERHALTFNTVADGPTWSDDSSRLRGVTFLPEHAASEQPAELEIRVPFLSRGVFHGVETCEISGRVVSAGDGSALPGLVLTFWSLEPAGGGQLRLEYGSNTVSSAPDGTYRIALPRGSSYAVWIRDAQNRKVLLEEEWQETAGLATLQRDFRIP
jgi:RNA polymerase sigma factor (sigma-70 family)